MLSRLNPILSRWRVALLRSRGVRVGAPCDVQGPVTIRHVLSRGMRGEIEIGARAQIARGVIIESWGGRVRLGAGIYVGPYSVIYGHGGVDIGDDTLVAMHVTIVSSNHALPPLGRSIQYQPDELRPTRIGRDVWLGAGAVVLGGVNIGDGCVVGAGAVVTKDIPAGMIVAGVPARVIGQRPKET